MPEPFSSHQVAPMIVWLLYGVGGMYFWLGRNGALKKRWWKPYVIGSGVLFVGIAYMWGFPPGMLVFLGLATAVMTKANLNALRICDSCGATVFRTNPFSRPEFCSKCGSKLPAG
jgi:hypothetical protein